MADEEYTQDTGSDEEEKLPLFLINGFLEAGKTQFIRFTMEQDYFQTEGLTLLLVCEEGEEEYDDGRRNIWQAWRKPSRPSGC